jgi:hypothetical protein
VPKDLMRGLLEQALGVPTGQTLVLDGGGISPFPLSRPPDNVQPVHAPPPAR